MNTSAIVQLFTMLAMFGITYLAFLAFGPPRHNLVFTKEEKNAWDSLIQTRAGSWFTLTNILGTLTSLATVYLFFIGSAQLFGAWTLLCCVTIWGGAFITNYFTKRLCESAHMTQLLNSPDQVGGVVATLFWNSSPEAKRTTRIIKWLSIASIAGIIWLEFALFSDIAGRLLGMENITYRGVLLLVCCFSVFYFTLRYGLRGFVFADAFQSPLIALSAVGLLVGAFWLATEPGLTLSLSSLLSPIVSTRECVLFAVHVTFLNLFLVLVSEPHWLRLWVFREKETRLQASSTTSTAIVWLLLIIVGFAAYSITGKIGDDAIVDLLQRMGSRSSVFPSLFWIGGIAALFSTADSQIYSFIVVKGFDINTGTLRARALVAPKPLGVSLIASITFLLLYLAVRILGLPFEKLVFGIVPLSLNLVPAFFLQATGRIARARYLIASVLLYSAATAVGLAKPEEQLGWTLAAAIAPFTIGLLGLLIERPVRMRDEKI